MICVDASLAVKWILDEERSDQAKALYRATVRAGRQIVAPPLLPLEVTNILRQRTRSVDSMSLDVATDLLDEFLALPIEIHNPDGLHRRALALACSLDLPAAYDAHYLALAEHLGCELWTDDQRLVRRVENDLSFVHRLSDYSIQAHG
jgi:predicted nucleic acid-binding protein